VRPDLPQPTHGLEEEESILFLVIFLRLKAFNTIVAGIGVDFAGRAVQSSRQSGDTKRRIARKFGRSSGSARIGAQGDCCRSLD